MSDDQNMLMCLAEYLRSVDKDAAKAFDYASKVDELRRRIAAEPIGYFINNARSGEKPHYAQIDPAFKSSPDVLPLYAAPVASGPRYDWSVSGMKQSQAGNWVMAGDAPTKGEHDV